LVIITEKEIACRAVRAESLFTILAAFRPQKGPVMAKVVTRCPLTSEDRVRFFPVSVIPMLHTDLQQDVVLTRKTTGRNNGPIKKAMLLRKSVRIFPL
jgi:hypothetical protein